MSVRPFTFQAGNLRKILSVPVYALGLLLSFLVPRAKNSWGFGSGIGVGEGSLELAMRLRKRDPDARITWLCRSEQERDQAVARGLEAVLKQTWRGFWITLRSDHLVVTHGLGDVNRFAIFGARVINLWHGAPIKKIHLDSPVTTQVRGPAWLRRLLTALYGLGAKHVDLYVAGSITSAERLRSAFRVDPGKVRVLGDSRLDGLRRQLDDQTERRTARSRILSALGMSDEHARLVLYAPTWRDGDSDAGIPNAMEMRHLQEVAERQDIHFVMRPHPLSEGRYAATTRVHILSAAVLPDLSQVLSTFESVITDYSSVAIDFSLTGRPILWFAPDLEEYIAVRGLYEPMEITSESTVTHSWAEVLDVLERALEPNSVDARLARGRSTRLRERFHEFPSEPSADRVLDYLSELAARDSGTEAAPSAFFESFYGAQATCNPFAIDRELARVRPDIVRYWSVVNVTVAVPSGAIPVLVGGPEWHQARRSARLLVVNDWMRYSFKPRKHQTVLQTWHGTPLKQVALGRPGLSWRTKMAVRRESSRWRFLLSENPHSTTTLHASYAFRGEVLELGYPRTDRLANSVIGTERIPLPRVSARHRLGIDPDVKVLLYAPTWRDGGTQLVDTIDVVTLSERLGSEWIILARGHSRTRRFGTYGNLEGRIIDVTDVPDVNDLLLSSDLLITDYSSIMFDASVALVPTVFFVPDLDDYRDHERGFTFDFEREAFGPFVTEMDELVSLVGELGASGVERTWVEDYRQPLLDWQTKFNALDDGRAGERVVDELRLRKII